MKSRLRLYGSSFSVAIAVLILPRTRRTLPAVGIGTPWKAALLLAAGAVGGAAAVAVASVPDGNGVIHACYQVSAPGSTVPAQTGRKRADHRPERRSSVQHGSRRRPHRARPRLERHRSAGAPGTNGTNGSPGAPGKSVTIPAGNTLTLGGGQVITVGNTPTVTIPAPQIGTRSIATLSFTGGITTDVLGFSFAAKPDGSGGGSGKSSTVHDIQITKPTDKSSPKLFLACANGQHFKKATLTVRKAGKQVVYTLTDVLIAAAQSTGHGEKLADSLTLNYAKLTIQTGKPHA